jgi:hypothetical protein
LISSVTKHAKPVRASQPEPSFRSFSNLGQFGWRWSRGCNITANDLSRCASLMLLTRANNGYTKLNCYK